MSPVRPGPSQVDSVRGEKDKRKANKDEAEDCAVKMVQDAEASKARVYDVPGENQIESRLKQIRMEQQGKHVVNVAHSVDDNYMLVASHVEDVTRAKVLNHQYVDFAKLIKRD